MHMRINTNLTAMNTFTQYTKNNSKIASSVAKLSSGYAINTAADNAAGLAISEKMRALIRGLDKATANAQDAISLVQTAEGALSSSTEILQRMRELAVQSSSDTNENQLDRAALQDEFSQLQKELNDIARNTTFNKKNLLDGSLATVSKSLGTTTLANRGITIQLGNASAGYYNFSVDTKLISAAVTARQPDTPELITAGAASYFAAIGNSAALGAHAAASALLNGNYVIKAAYADPTNDNGDGQIKVTATGDNGQSFSATITAATLSGLSSTKTLSISFGQPMDDAFNLTLNLANTVTAGESNYDALADAISRLSVSVTGGVTQRDAAFGVYANLTGAESIRLESGMNSVTFDNGVTVKFEALPSSAVDTTNRATTGVSTGAVATAGGTSTLGHLRALNHSSIANGTLTISSSVDGGGNTVITAQDAGGSSYASTLTPAQLAALQTSSTTPATTALTFKDTNGNASFTMDFISAASVSGVSTALNGATAFDGISLTVSGAGHYYANVFADTTVITTTTYAGITMSPTAMNGNAIASGTTGAWGTFSNFSVGSATLAEGAMQIESNSTANDFTGTVTFTATDSAGHAFTASDVSQNLVSTSIGTTLTNTLTFTNGTYGSFSLQLQIYSGSLVNNHFINSPYTTNVSILNPATVTTTGQGLAASTASSFSVEETSNAGLTFQVSGNDADFTTIHIEKMDADYLGVASACIENRSRASAAIGVVDSAINQVSAQRAYLGAILNRLAYKISNLVTSSENLTAAESQIRDVDTAKEMAMFTNTNILQQAAASMLAQANSLPQNVLSLLKR
jgi:flagellin